MRQTTGQAAAVVPGELRPGAAAFVLKLLRTHATLALVAEPAGINKKTAPGKPFPPGKSGNPSGRPKKTVTWKAAEDLLRATIPILVMMTDKELRELMKRGPSVAEALAIAYIQEHPIEAVNRFLGKPATPLTGGDGAPLIPAPVPSTTNVFPPLDFAHPLWTPERLDKFIEATGKKG